MTIYLKQNTASQEVPLGHFVDDDDGKTAETGLTIANTDIKIWKNGATSLANKNSGGGTHMAGGVYYCVLDATDTNTLGPLVIYVAVSGALAVKVECCVLAANIFDSLIGGGDLLDVSVVQWTGTAVATPDTAGYVKATLKAGTGTGEVNLSSGVVPANVTQFGGTNGTFSGGRPEVNTTLIEGSDATNQIRDSILSDATRLGGGNLNTLASHDPGETIMGATDLGTGSGLTSLASAANLATVAGYLDTEIADIKAKTDNLPSDPADASVVAGLIAAVEAKVDIIDANVDAVLVDTGTTLDGKLDTIDGNVDAVKAKTDSLTFTVAGHIDANILYVNGHEITGDGDGTPWGPA